MLETSCKVIIASPNGLPVKVAEGFEINADCSFKAANLVNISHILVPGGDIGSMVGSSDLNDLLNLASSSDSVVIGGICSGALLLGQAGLLNKRKCTHMAVSKYACGPEFKELIDFAKNVMPSSIYVDDDVVIDGNIITAKPWAYEAFSEQLMAFSEQSRPESNQKSKAANVDRHGTLHLVYGFCGSGKTTFAKRLEQEKNAARFTHDEWMVALYGNDPPADRFREYADNIEKVIWRYALKLLSLGTDVILDFGFWSRESRDLARKMGESAKAKVRLYYLDCSMEVMAARVEQRTSQRREEELYISKETFETLKARFEPLAADEEHLKIKPEQVY